MAIKKKENITEMRQLLAPIYPLISWQAFTKLYFDKSSAWLYQKIDEITPFKYCDLVDFRDSLKDLTKEINDIVEELDDVIKQKEIND